MVNLSLYSLSLSNQLRASPIISNGRGGGNSMFKLDRISLDRFYSSLAYLHKQNHLTISRTSFSKGCCVPVIVNSRFEWERSLILDMITPEGDKVTILDCQFLDIRAITSVFINNTNCDFRVHRTRFENCFTNTVMGFSNSYRESLSSSGIVANVLRADVAFCCFSRCGSRGMGSCAWIHVNSTENLYFNSTNVDDVRSKIHISSVMLDRGAQYITSFNSSNIIGELWASGHFGSYSKLCRVTYMENRNCSGQIIYSTGSSMDMLTSFSNFIGCNVSVALIRAYSYTTRYENVVFIQNEGNLHAVVENAPGSYFYRCYSDKEFESNISTFDTCFGGVQDLTLHVVVDGTFCFRDTALFSSKVEPRVHIAFFISQFLL